MKSIIVVTNNDSVYKQYSERFECILKNSYYDVLETTRNFIHQGKILLTHPMASSLKSNQTPYRTILLEDDLSRNIDMESLTMIEQAVETYHKFQALRKLPEYTDKVKEDFKTIDLSLVESAMVHWKGGR